MPAIKERGIILNTMCWRDPDTHEVIAGMDTERVLGDVGGRDLRSHTFVLQELLMLMLEGVGGREGRDTDGGTNGEGETGGTEDGGGEGVGETGVRWGRKVVAVGQDGKRAWVECETEDGGRERFEGDYVVGCDGANSAVRKGLFGAEFPGFTWDEQIIATNVSFWGSREGMGRGMGM